MSVLDTRDNLLKLLGRLATFMQRDFVSTLNNSPGNLNALYEFMLGRTSENAHPLLSSLAKQRRSAQQPQKQTIVADKRSAGGRKMFVNHTVESNEGRENVEAKNNEPSQSNHKQGCVLCSGERKLIKCDEFREMKRGKKIGSLKRNRLCFNCMMPDHMSRNCKKPNSCQEGNCGFKEKHHPVLHADRRDGITQKQSQGPKKG